MISRNRSRQLRASALAAAALLAAFCSCSQDMLVKPARRAEVTGTIRDPEGNALAGYRVYITEGLGSTTDSSGHYSVIVPEGSYRPIVSPRGYPVTGFPRVQAGWVRVRAPVTRWDYSYGGFKVQGSVTGPDGSPVDSGIVDAYQPGSSNYGYGTEVRVNIVAGRYKLYLTGGSYRLFISPEYAVPRGIPNLFPPDVTISADTTMDFALTGEAVTGTVTLGAGVPLEGATVGGSGSVSSAAVTKADGSYLLYLPAGDYDWYARPGPQNRNVMLVRQAGPGVTGPTTINFDLSGVHWSGTVRWSGTGLPIPSVEVTAILGYSDKAVSTTDGAGQFDLVVRPAVRQSLKIHSPAGEFADTYRGGVLAGNDSTFDLVVSPPSP